MATEKSDIAVFGHGVDDKVSDDLPTGPKTAEKITTTDGDVENGHLMDLEVDIGGVLAKGEEEGDWDADTSPFPAVRAVVPETDDPAIPVNTFRAWFLGIVSSEYWKERVLELLINICLLAVRLLGGGCEPILLAAISRGPHRVSRCGTLGIPPRGHHGKASTHRPL